MKLDFDKMGGLVPAIIQDIHTQKVLMLGFMNEEAYQKTVESGKVTFYSRTKQRLWTKGEESGNFLHVESIQADCDNDTLLIQVTPCGPVCHLGTDTCWGDKNEQAVMFLKELQVSSTAVMRKCPNIPIPPVCLNRESTKWRRRWAKRQLRPLSRPATEQMNG